MAGFRRQCYVCKRKFLHFYSYREGQKAVSPFVRSLALIEGDLDNCYCPYCRSHDRERHLYMYFDRLNLWSELGGKVLHFGPERNLCLAIEKVGPEEYIKADLFPKSKGIRRIDITKIEYPDEYFDFVICNHVLEHVPNVEEALGEVFRVLKGDRKAVLQTPYSSILANSFEDRNINTDRLRRRFYGQEDHVRIFGQGFFSKLENAGFHLHIKRHEAVLSEIDWIYYGVNPKEDLILVWKP